MFQIKDDSHEFRPILAEIEESPVSPLGRTTFWIIVAIILFTILWTCIGKVDIVVSARGKIIPDGNIKIVQPLDTGIIKKILVKEGSYVHKGQILAEIDQSSTEPQLKSMKKNLNYIEIEKRRLDATSSNLVFLPPVPGIENMEAVKTQENIYKSSMDGLDKQLNAKKLELKKIDEQIKSAEAAKENYETLLNMSQTRKKRLEAVVDIIAKDDLEKAIAEVENYSSQFNQTRFKLEELNHQKDQILQEIEYTKESFKTDNLKELSDREKQSTQMQANIEEVAFKNVKQKIVSPVDGYVISLSIHTVGGVVTPAEKLISIVPSDSPLIVNATVSNRDIGFVKAGMPVSIKIDTFDFQKYGILRGKVRHVSNDSVDDPKLGPVYNVFITPLDKSLLVERKRQSISSGMSLTAEIKIGKRRIIEFFIYPLIKYWNEGISVR